MGVLVFGQTNSHLIMKVLLIVALAIAAVVAEPEADAKADPAGYYGYYGLGSGYNGQRHAGYYGYPVITSLDNKWGHNLGKRDAEADPAYGYYGYGTYRGFPYARLKRALANAIVQTNFS